MRHALFILTLALVVSAQAQMITTPVSVRSDSLRSFFDHFTSIDTDRWVEVTGGGSSDCSVTGSELNCITTSGNRGAALWLAKRLPKDVDWTIAFTVESNGCSFFWPAWGVDQAEGSEAIFTGQADATHRWSCGNSSNVLLEYWNDSGTRCGWNGSAWVCPSTATSVVNWPTSNRYRTFLLINDGVNEQWSTAVVEHALPNLDTAQGVGLQTWTDWVAWSATRGTGDNQRFVVGFADDRDTDNNTNYEFVKLNIGGGRKWALVNGQASLGSGWRIYWVQAFGGDHEDGLIWLPEDADTSPPTIAIDVGSGGSWDDNFVKDKSIAVSPSGATHPYYIAYSADDGSTLGIGIAHATTLGGTITKGSNNPLIPTGGGGGEPTSGNGGCDGIDFYYDNADSRWVMLASCLDSGGTEQLHWWTNTNSDPEASGNWTYQDTVAVLGSGGTWDDDRTSNPVVYWRGDQYEVLYAGSDGSATVNWGWGLTQGTSLSSMTKYGSNPVQPIGDGTSESAGTVTDGNQVTVTASSAYADDECVVFNDDATTGNYIRSVIRDASISSTVIELYQYVTFSSATIWECDAGSVTTHHLWDTQRLGHAERYVVYNTCFDWTNAYNEMVCHGLTSGLTTQPSFDWTGMVGFSAISPDFDSWENIAIPNRTKR